MDRRMAPHTGGQRRNVPTATSQPTLTVELEPVPESVRRARRALTQGGLDTDLDHTVSLLASEVVTNAVRHAAEAGPITLAATLDEGYARVEVLDRGPGFDPDVRRATAGFGLRLLDKLATRWGVERGSGTLVWFEVDRRRRRFGRA